MVSAVFLDRDGVIVVPEFRDGRSYAPRNLEDLVFFSDAIECLLRLKAAGFMLVVVTNQPDVGNGIVPLQIVEEMHKIIETHLPVDLIKVCYHKQTDGCSCRKPFPGMLLNAARELNLDLSSSFIIGDRESDIEAGKACGCKTVFIDLDYNEKKPSHPSHSAKSLSDATEWILSHIDCNVIK